VPEEALFRFGNVATGDQPPFLAQRLGSLAAFPPSALPAGLTRKLGTRTQCNTPGGRAAPKGIGTARALLSLPLILLIPLAAKNFLVVQDNRREPRPDEISDDR
jgi:hypothetical protein